MTAPWSPPAAPPPTKVTSITAPQRDVLDRICKGWPNRRIARDLGISEDAVRYRTKALLNALYANDRTHAAVLAVTGQVTIHVRDRKIGWS